MRKFRARLTLLHVIADALVIGSTIGLLYYLRIIAAMAAATTESAPALAVVSLSTVATLAILTLLQVGLGIYSAPLIICCRRPWHAWRDPAAG